MRKIFSRFAVRCVCEKTSNKKIVLSFVFRVLAGKNVSEEEKRRRVEQRTSVTPRFSIAGILLPARESC
jgi:hypothetical protein